MISLQVEPLKKVEPEARGFMYAYFEEVGTPFEKAVNWDYYRILENSGLLNITTLRDDDTLVGFEAFLIGAHPHASDTIVAQELAVYVHPNYRGLDSLRMMRFAENAAKERGARYCIVSARGGNLLKLLPRRGYKPFEYSFVKEL